MSLENELSRIATAFERIAGALEIVAEKKANTLIPAGIAVSPVMESPKDPTPPLDQGNLGVVAKEVFTPPVNPVTAQSPVAEAEALPTTTKELLELAQNVASKLEDKCPAFVTWCNTALLPKYNVNKIKLIPQIEVANAAKEIMGYAARLGIKV